MRELVVGAVTVSAVTLILFGALSDSWYTAEGAVEINVGLRDAEFCVGGRRICRSYALERIMRRGGGGVYRAFANITFYAAIFAAIGLALGVALREIQGADGPARWAGIASLLLVPLALLTMFTFPGRDTLITSFSIGRSFFLTLVGALAGGVAGFATFAGVGASRVRPYTGQVVQVTPQRATTGPAVAPRPSGTEQVARDLAQHTSEAVTEALRTERARSPGRKLPLGRGRTPGPSAVRPVAADSSRESLRFVVREGELTDDGLIVQLERGGGCEILWADLEQVVVRRLPPDPPFNGTIFVDLIPSLACPTRQAPVRLLPTSKVNYPFFGGGVGATSTDNFRRLGAFIDVKRPGIIERESRPFFLENQAPPRFPATCHLADYEARFTE